ncbi:hypothetical protein B0A55_07858 [Friedmanniomyces simplex]|uniref:Chromatin assembly factor 1 subunit A dimerization domain-containing protein n=1 Tax=Friedmanniomyces simplex TaxID=329884 RepID=A0A4U0X362_9PEZI|nr:hypothetical protein B0A55_07858 [Friedmanniomyces simplex]
MEDIDSSPTSPNPRKRAAPDEASPDRKPLNLKGTQFVMPTPTDTEDSSNPSPVGSLAHQREASPALSISTMTSVEIVGSNAMGEGDASGTPTASNAKPPPAKRRKLTPSEKLDKTREKEAKENERAEQKARKDEEKRVKDEEKRQKAEEREAKKREKELEEQRKEDAKLKKERSQMRLASFFGAKPATPGKPATANGSESVSARRKSLSLEPFDAVANQIRRSESPTKGAPPPQATAAPTPLPVATKPTVSDYRKYFLPFEVRPHTTLAPTYNIPNPDDLAYWQGDYDSDMKDPTFREKVDLGLVEPTAVVDNLFERNTRRGLPLPSMRALVDRIQGSSKEPIDLTQEGPAQQQPLEAAMQQVTRRYLHFEVDVRPPYFGTYTQIKSPRTTRHLMLNPFSRARKDTDYDYDSEAEWEEPEEGDDDVGDEEEEAESLGDADEMDGFLDDEDDSAKNKRKLITGDLQPNCTGLCWENDANVILQSIEGVDTAGTPKEMHGMRTGILLPGFSGQTIDPFSTTYWAHEMAPPSVPISDAPARPPLQERHSNGSLTQKSLLGAAEGEKGPITSAAASQGAKRGPKAQPKVLSKEDLDEFKDAVVGSALGKVELAKGLKTR